MATPDGARASLIAIISPLAAFSLNLYFPALSTYHSKTGSGISIPIQVINSRNK
jgi:hypothetical protein